MCTTCSHLLGLGETGLTTDARATPQANNSQTKRYKGCGRGRTLPTCTHPPLDPHQCILTFDLITRRQTRPDTPNSGNVVFLKPKENPKTPKTRAQKPPKKARKTPKADQNSIYTDRPPKQPVNLPQLPPCYKQAHATPPQLALHHFPQKNTLF